MPGIHRHIAFCILLLAQIVFDVSATDRVDEPLAPASKLESAATQSDAPIKPQRFSVHLNNTQVGSMNVLRVRSDRRAITQEQFTLQLGRSGTSLHISSERRSEESVDGHPIAFSSRTDAGGAISDWEGRIDEAGQLKVIVRQGDSPRTETMQWPTGALLAEGLQLAQQAHGYKPGTHYRLRAFDVDSLTPYDIEVSVGAEESVPINGKPEMLIPLTQQLLFERGSTESMSWVRADGSLRQTRLSIVGLELTITACDDACTDTPVGDTDILAATLVASPAPITLPQRHRDLALIIAVDAQARDDVIALRNVPGQQLSAVPGNPDHYRLLIESEGSSQRPPTAADTAPTRWLQSDADTVREFAAAHAGSDTDASSSMRNLERAVRAHISNKSLQIGYASAVDTLASQEGDCTEHAVLLAALARASGIPARVATGLVYADSYAGRRDVFIPHAWVQAWVDGRWRGYDAALNGFDSGHLGFNVGDGDPYRYYQGMALLGRLRIVDVVASDAAR